MGGFDVEIGRNKWMEAEMDGCWEGWRNGCDDGCRDGWMEAGMDGWKQGWIDAVNDGREGWLFVWFDSLRTSQHFSVMSGRVFVC